MAEVIDTDDKFSSTPGVADICHSLNVCQGKPQKKAIGDTMHLPCKKLKQMCFSFIEVDIILGNDIPNH